MAEKKILLVDDVRLFLELEKSFLKRPEFEIFTAVNGLEALKIARLEHPDLILLDLHMPQMDGCECCRKLKGDPSLNDIPVIMVTTAGDQEDRDRCGATGCDDYIAKPIDRAQLLEKVKKYLDIPVRLHERVPVDADVRYYPVDAKVFYYAEGKEYSGRASDISEGGIFVECDIPLPIGTAVDLGFELPGTGGLVTAKGKVSRVVSEFASHPSRIVPGMGISFTELTEEGRNAISAYIISGDYMV